METLKPAEKVNQLYEQFNELTTGMLHNSLWQLIVNQPERKNAAFVFIHGKGSHGNVGIVDAGMTGYTPATFSIKTEVSEDQREQMLDKLNEEVFGITPKRAFELELQSYRK